MSYITTYTKQKFDPLNPNMDLVCIEDIAHALSLLCRANGHFPHFYSVAQHSINCCLEAKARGYDKNIQLACLLHDASEAYISDITRPIKKEISNYLSIEDKLQTMIFDKWLDTKLTPNEYETVFSVDDEMLYFEFVELMDERISQQQHELKSKPQIDFVDFKTIEKTFLRLFKDLTNECKSNICIGIDRCKKSGLQ